MHSYLRQLAAGVSLTGDLSQDAPAFLIHHDCPKTATHVADVAAESRRIALLFGADPDVAEAAGWLHDISAVIPVNERVIAANTLGVNVIPEESRFPMIVHQKLSAIIASEIFRVTDTRVLSAIGCHTTLKSDAALLDKVVFVADKIAWDQPGTPPYLDSLLTALEDSIDQAALVYLKHLWDMRDRLKVIHPWMREAYLQLARRYGAI